MDEAPPTGSPLIIGVIGLGRMGAPVARALAAEFAVGGFDIDHARGASVPGIRSFGTARDLAAASEVLVTVLPGPAELREVMSEALPALPAGALWLDLTSGDPLVTRALAAQAHDGSIDVVSAPMGGSVAEAERAALIFYLSGAESAVERAVSVLRPLSRPDGLRRAGSRPEDAQIAKLLANGLWFAHALAAAEALLIGQGLGMQPSDLHRLLRDSAGGSRFLDDHAERLLEGDYLTTFGLDRVVDELDTVAAMGRAAGTPTPVLDASGAAHRAALERYGPELGELLAARMLEEDAGRTLRREQG
ncbi:hypothetical protein AUC47_14310 [Microbacterium sp. SZ1]|uniref:NAD(P)-dependent oxidoreductase n=1 Tax=Microbacterium sp. SZ1 TaxID=1849736 RepID=UPI000BBC0414|nr:NAD(P)-binding domain-containing protein [Microbacterium sp. SZ1]PCE15269.1 hypothetical protein AUC47_14310 [Microbacterium sp. SZ1]